MATSVLASAIIPLSIDVVWSHLRDFTFPERLLSSIISKVEIDGNNPFHIGTVRKMVWKTGEMRSHRLIGLSDQYHIITWELIDSDPPVETSAIITRIKCIRISEQNHTLVEWSADYGSDVPASFITFEQKSFQENLAEIRASLTGSTLPILYHLNEAPSTRVVWLAYELGIPLKIQEATPAVATIDLRKSRETEMPADKGGMVASYVEVYPSSNKNNNNKNEREEEHSLVLLESGAIIYYLLEKHDSHFMLFPKQHTLERALFHKYMFFASSTADHLLFESYKHMYVVDTGEYGEEILETNRRQWYQHVGPEFAKQLKANKYLCGDRFTAADVMLGWTLYIANLLGWLEDLPVLQNYFQTLYRRPAFQRAFYVAK